MKETIGILLVIAGIASGIYFGLWWAFIGGIISIVEQVRSPAIDAMTLALGIVRILFAAFIGWVCALVLIIPGVAILKSE